MQLSKTELSIGIEMVYSITFALVFLPFFFHARGTHLIWEDLVGPGIEILIYTVVFFSVAYGALELARQHEITEDERGDLIQAKAYKAGYILYELALFIGVGHLIRTAPEHNGHLLFTTLALLLAVSLTKSTYQLYLHRTL